MFSILMRARLYYLLDQHLSASVIHLKDESIKLYKRFLAYLEACKDEDFDFGNDTSKIEDRHFGGVKTAMHEFFFRHQLDA